jgi:hypothetical protein
MDTQIKSNANKGEACPFIRQGKSGINTEEAEGCTGPAILDPSSTGAIPFILLRYASQRPATIETPRRLKWSSDS